MPYIVKSNAVLRAEQLTEQITAPGPDGIPVIIAREGMWVTYAEADEGLTFKGFITEDEFREKHRRV